MRFIDLCPRLTTLGFPIELGDNPSDDLARFAVRLYQFSRGLVVDGRPGKNTYADLDAFLDAREPQPFWDGELDTRRAFGMGVRDTRWWRIGDSGQVLVDDFDATPTSLEIRRAEWIWEEHGELIEQYEEDAASQLLLRMIIQTESNGNPQSYRHEPQINDGSYGLGQFLGGTARGLGYNGDLPGLFDPETNLKLMVKYLSQQSPNTFLDPVMVAAAWNAGSVRPSRDNPFGLVTYGDHIPRSLRHYNAAVVASGVAAPVEDPDAPLLLALSDIQATLEDGSLDAETKLRRIAGVSSPFGG
ncbi:MAG: lytic transglycosylase domain-containing protein [Candidatus Poribacteria bacterium]|nr:lytic transglycosylase domain-containing protein [Candidatus Poribacteria bacterium]